MANKNSDGIYQHGFCNNTHKWRLTVRFILYPDTRIRPDMYSLQDKVRFGCEHFVSLRLHAF